VAEFGSSLKKDLTAEEFERFRDWIHKHSGIYLEETKLDSLRISLVTRATRFGFLDYAEYYRMLIACEDEFKELMNLVTINETSFFRFPAQFDALRDLVIPEILEHKSPLSHSFRAWSAGCSTGEEPYTIAMTLLDSAIDASAYRCEVFGTDVSTQALDRARQAIYPARALANLPQNVVQRWFEPVAGGHRPVERVRDIVDVSYHNLVKEPYPNALLGNWDLIFCRNVTIYFRVESTRRVVDNFYDSLNPGGYLFIGHSETLSGISNRFESVEVGGVFLYRKPVRRLHATGGLPPSRADEPRRPTVAELSAAHIAALTAAAPRTAGQGYTCAPAATPVHASAQRSATAPAARDAAAGATERVAATVPAPPTPADALVAEAHALLEQARPSEARAAAEQALQLEPRCVQAILVTAYAHADSGDFDAAIAEANSALAIDPLLAPARYILGIIYQRQGNAAAALNEFRRTIYIDQEFVLAHFNAANIHRARGAIEEACREYENTLRALYVNPTGSWTVFLGGFRPDLLAKTCERSLIECRRGT
jgi:chemotaxis protein methyltransferase CheR